MGKNETCNGDPIRRLGDEYSFSEIAIDNISRINQYKFKKIIVQCPHCLHTLGKEYAQFENGRYVLRPGHKPCTTCHGTGNCKAYNMCSSSVDSDWAFGRSVDLTCQICRGERFQVCDYCKGSGYRNKF